MSILPQHAEDHAEIIVLERVPWARLSACAGVYTAPTALVVAPALADARVLAATGWAPGALTLASGLMFVASAPGAVVGSSAADRLGRRPVAFWTTLGCGICIAALLRGGYDVSECSNE